MREPVTRRQAFLVAVDLFNEAGEPELAMLMHKAAAQRTDVARLLQDVAYHNWEAAHAHLAAIERKANGIPDSEVENFIDWATGYHEQILEDGVVEVSRLPRILRQPANLEGEHGYAVSGWFYLEPGSVMEEEEPRPTWGDLGHEGQTRLLEHVLGAEQGSLRWSGMDDQVTGRPNYGQWVGMTREFGLLRYAIDEAIRQGYLRDER